MLHTPVINCTHDSYKWYCSNINTKWAKIVFYTYTFYSSDLFKAHTNILLFIDQYGRLTVYILTEKYSIYTSY